MRWLLALLACGALTTFAPVVTAAPADPDTTPILLVHGFDGHGSFSCHSFDGTRRLLGRRRAITVGLYALDTGCDTPSLAGATVQTSVADLARHVADVAEAIPGPVDLVGHSMGGLVVELAYTDLPPGKVRAMATLETPYDGLPTAVGCPVRQCQDMLKGSAVERQIQLVGPHSDLCVGSRADEFLSLEEMQHGCRRTLTVSRDHHAAVLSDGHVIDAVLRALA